MSRINYSEDEDYPGQFELFRANVRRSVRSKAGQAALRDLREALLALPNKRLVAHYLAKDGDVCTTGALVLKRRSEAEAKPFEALAAEMSAETEGRASCECYHERRAHKDGTGACSECIRWHAEVAAMPEETRFSIGREPCEAFEDGNWGDEDEEGIPEAEAVAVGVPKLVAWRLVELNDMDLDRETPEERYAKVLAWVEKRLELGAKDNAAA
jgi:hypothetical protein